MAGKIHKWHKSPDGKLRICAASQKCKYSLPDSEHQFITTAEAHGLNNQVEEATARKEAEESNTVFETLSKKILVNEKSHEDYEEMIRKEEEKLRILEENRKVAQYTLGYDMGINMVKQNIDKLSHKIGKITKHERCLLASGESREHILKQRRKSASGEELEQIDNELFFLKNSLKEHRDALKTIEPTAENNEVIRQLDDTAKMLGKNRETVARNWLKSGMEKKMRPKHDSTVSQTEFKVGMAEVKRLADKNA